MKVDFKNLIILNVEGAEEKKDISKDLGKIMWQTAQDPDEDTLARAIFKDGIVELTDKQMEAVSGYINKNFLGFVIEAWNKLADK